MKRRLIIAILLFVVVLCGVAFLGTTYYFASMVVEEFGVFFAPTSTPTLEEEQLVKELASRLGVPADWTSIFDYVNSTYISLGISREEVHARIGRLGAFRVEEAGSFPDEQGRRLFREKVSFENSYLQDELGFRDFSFDADGLLQRVDVCFEKASRDCFRALP